MNTIYRLSDSHYNKLKPSYVNVDNCLTNFIGEFSNPDVLILDNVLPQNASKYLNKGDIVLKSEEGNAGSFLLALDLALELDDDELVYFIEDDYIHAPKSKKALEQAFSLGVDFVTLYDHPDKHEQKLLEEYGATDLADWFAIPSTTMTFAARVDVLRETKQVFQRWCAKQHPHDFYLWTEITKHYKLISPQPSFSTHGEVQWLARGHNWEDYVWR